MSASCARHRANVPLRGHSRLADGLPGRCRHDRSAPGQVCPRQHHSSDRKFGIAETLLAAQAWRPGRWRRDAEAAECMLCSSARLRRQWANQAHPPHKKPTSTNEEGGWLESLNRPVCASASSRTCPPVVDQDAGESHGGAGAFASRPVRHSQKKPDLDHLEGSPQPVINDRP
jgi:hypothetical protein